MCVYLGVYVCMCVVSVYAHRGQRSASAVALWEHWPHSALDSLKVNSLFLKALLEWLEGFNLFVYEIKHN